MLHCTVDGAYAGDTDELMSPTYLRAAADEIERLCREAQRAPVTIPVHYPIRGSLRVFLPDDTKGITINWREIAGGIDLDLVQARLLAKTLVRFADIREGK